MNSELEKIREKIRKDYQKYLDSLSEEERKKELEEYEEFDKEYEEFWEIEYPSLNLKEKKKYWLAGTHKGMRTQGEALADEYSHFSKEWYEGALEVEPKFDEIFTYVTENLGFEFDWKEYYKRIKE